MQILEAIRRAVMKPDISLSSLRSRSAKALADEARAQQALDAFEAGVSARTVKGPADELAWAREDKERDRLQSTLRHTQRQARDLQAAIDAAEERDIARADEARWKVAESEYGEWIAAETATDRAIATLVGCMKRASEARVKVFEALPVKPDHFSFPMFAPQTTQVVIEQRLFGLTTGEWQPRRIGLITHDEARRLPTLADRVETERRLILAKRLPVEQTGPEAA